MIRRMVVLMVSVGLCVSLARAGIYATGDVIPANTGMWTTTDIGYVGETGAGRLTIDGGSDFDSLGAVMGYGLGATGVATVHGVGSTWTNNGLYVGYEGHGALDITNGGSVISTFSEICFWPGGTGVVTVSGAGSTWTNSLSLAVGTSGGGQMHITNGGAVRNPLCYIATWAEGTGAVTVSGTGSTWANTSDLYVGFAGGGTLSINDGGLVSVAGGLTIDANGDGDSFINMGTGGMLALSGNADDSLESFLDLVSGTGEIRYRDDSTSDWADITGATEGEDYTLGYLAEGELVGYTVLTVTTPTEPATPGDTNDDYIVNGLDLANLVAQFGVTPDVESADFNGDDIVNLEDFAVMRGNFGFGVVSSPSGDPEAITTPEPATLSLLALGGLALIRRRRSCGGRA